ncbi:MAG TPA: IS701 family transposase [Gammaproteobacteria bacterium]|nr:IS701 family transposase [Gammaproteobacteria bacterium]
MEAQYQERKDELIAECEVAPQILERVRPRLIRFMSPFVDTLARKEQTGHAQTFVQGLLSDLDNKNVESIAYRFGQDRMPLQRFVGFSKWDDEPLRDELARQIGTTLGEEDGVIVFDPSAFPKSGQESVGVARQWCGRLGKVDNCQVGVYMGYVSSQEHALVDMRLFLPKVWTKDRKRRQKAGIPKGIRFKTRHQLCLEMLKKHGEMLPHTWIYGDDEMGRPYWFRRRLDRDKEQYLLSVQSTTLVRDLEAKLPLYSGRGPRPKRPWTRVSEWAASIAEGDWTSIDVRDGAKGPLTIEAVKRRVVARTDKRQEGHEETLVVIRYKDRDDQSVLKIDYYLSNANAETELAEFARVAKAEHRIEECIQRAKGEAGLADYEVRTWTGWHHHQTLSLIATWFLVTEARRGKKMDTGDYRSTDPRRHFGNPPTILQMRYTLPHKCRTPKAIGA